MAIITETYIDEMQGFFPRKDASSSLREKTLCLLCNASDDDIIGGLLEIYNDHCKRKKTIIDAYYKPMIDKFMNGVDKSEGILVSTSDLPGSQSKFYSKKTIYIDPQTMMFVNTPNEKISHDVSISEKFHVDIPIVIKTLPSGRAVVTGV